MMQQFFDLKSKHPDALILFRCGDFYETYGDDAATAADILGITLTKRNNGAASSISQQTAMAGFPYHALDTYLPKLIRAGKRVAICDQLEDPKLTKKLVKRGITEVITPGIIIEDNVLENKENNFLAALTFGKHTCGLALLDASTGEFYVAEDSEEKIIKILNKFTPKELLYRRSDKSRLTVDFTPFNPYPLDDWAFNEQTAIEKIQNHFEISNLKGLGIDNMHEAITSAGAVLFYLLQTHHTNINHISLIKKINDAQYVHMDNFTIKSLELCNTMNSGGSSLLSVIDKTTSPMGGRMLRKWILFPLIDTDAIHRRQQVVKFLVENAEVTDFLTEQLRKIGDMERIVTKIATLRSGPRDLNALKTALQAIGSIEDNFAGSDFLNDHPQFRELITSLNGLQNLSQRIEKTIVADPPLLIGKGGVITNGINQELDTLRTLAYSGKDYLLKLQEREIQNTGISSLKIGFNNVFGYYIEVRNTFKSKVPAEWIRKQTLVSAERYITQELKEYEEKILGAEEKILTIETKIFNDLVSYTQGFITQIQKNANTIAKIDCLLSFAHCANEYDYVCPEVNDSTETDICQGRHPVIGRQMPPGEQYVANDIHLDTDTQQVIILTGPNMAGKSALLRQTALITLMAQIGSFVPAQNARIGIVDKIFTRVGASDNISAGESTFMVEMNEASNILNNLSQRSLVLFDELGRGTSTYDGISIAWAIVEYIHENASCHPRTLFATHYHELNELESQLTRVKNYNISVRESDGKILFLRKLKRGGSEHSFGIHVAQIAGMTSSVVQRAKQILKQLEGDERRETRDVRGGRLQNQQLSFFQLDDPVLCQIRDELLNIDVNNLTPLEALNKLNEIKKILKG